ncbi:MAG: hypothetical protein KGI08_08060 [Thaumarchaeota archaeon]|nr:hypothetical protein [Nitrososphaerota archaeon]
MNINKKSINKFVILVILMMVVPEAIGHILFEKAHPAGSSVEAAIALTTHLRDSNNRVGICHLAILNDPQESHISRAAGLEGKYANYTCSPT